ncbi:MAG TPA: amino acid permease, partial [Planctomycetota bacterium]|nr:amino acid permease [Planctomycetota bacterium]
VPVSAAADGLFFRAFSRLHPRWRTPHVALGVAGALSGLLLLELLSKRLLQVFDFVLLLSVLTTLLPHLLAMAAQFAFARREGRVGAACTSAIAFAFVLLTIAGCGGANLLWGLCVLAAGVPLYAWLRR